MRDISALTPPLLMCAVVLLAIGAFLRHEMGRKRPEDIDQPQDIPASLPNSPAGLGAKNEESAEPSADDDEG